MAVIYEKNEATAQEVFDTLGDFPTYNAARSTLRVLEAKGHLQHEQRGSSYVYQPTVARDQARGSWLNHLVRTLFGGSATALVTTLLDEEIASDEELARVERLIRSRRSQTRKRGARK